MALIRRRRAERPAYMMVIDVPGLIYIRIDHLPRWLGPAIAAIASPALAAWLLTR